MEVNRGRCWVVDADIASFFDEIRPEVLRAALAERVSDRRMRKLVMGWLKAGVLAGETLLHPQAGTPQGGAATRKAHVVSGSRRLEVWLMSEA